MGLVTAAHAQPVPPPPKPQSIRACAGIDADAARLACYDRITGRKPETAPHAEPTQHAPSAQTRRNEVFPHGNKRHREVAAATGSGAPPKRALSLLDSRWELAPDSKLGTFNVRGYRPVYLLPVFYTTNVDNRPSSPTPGHTVTHSLGYQHTEAKFQLSLKTKLVQGLFGDRGDLWFGYTQTSRWQVYNSRLSRPFHETDYEPEMMLVFDTHYHLLGMNGRLLGIGIEHESNGQSNPLSRSWNRVVADIGFERGSWTLMLRPWWRIPDKANKDDNPDIQDYMGRGDIQIVHEAGGNEFSLMARHSFRGGSRSHGAVRLTWAFPIHAKLRGYVQIFDGYGESMIDYNHRATYVGLGISLLGWY